MHFLQASSSSSSSAAISKSNSASNPRYDNCMQGPNGFNQAIFMRTMQLTKPFWSVPENETDKELGRIPFESLHLQMALKKKSWSAPQEKFNRSRDHLCRGGSVSEFNKWRWLAHRTSLLMSEALRSMQVKQEAQASIDYFWEMTKSLDNGIGEIENYLSVPCAGKQNNDPYFERGKEKLLEVQTKLQGLSQTPSVVKIKKYLTLLTQSLQNREELFPLLLMPATDQDQMSDHGMALIEAMQKTAGLRPREAEMAIEQSLAPCMRALRENLKKSLPLLEDKKKVLEAIEKILDLAPKLGTIWKKAAKLDTNPELLKCKELAKQAREGKPFTFQMHRDWSEAVKNFTPPLDLTTSLKAFEDLWISLSTIHNILGLYISPIISEQTPHKFKNQAEEDNFRNLVNVFHNGFTQTKKDAQTMLIARFENFTAIINSFRHNQGKMWEEQKKGLATYEQWLSSYPSTLPPSLERISEAWYSRLPTLNLLNAPLFAEFSELVSALRIYDSQIGTLSDEAKAESIGSILVRLDRVETLIKRLDILSAFSAAMNQTNNQYLLDFVKSLRHLLGDGTHYHTDLFFLLHGTDLSKLSATTRDAMLRATLLIPKQYLEEYAPSFEQLVDSISEETTQIENNSFGTKGDRLILPLSQRLENFKKEVAERKIQLQALLSKDLTSVGNYLIAFKNWANAEKNAFLAEYNQIVASLLELVENKEVSEKALSHLEALLDSFLEGEHHKLETYIFSPTHLLRKWTLLESLKNSPPVRAPQSIAPPSLPPPQASSSQVGASSSSSVESKASTVKSIDLIDRVALAAGQKVTGPEPYAQDCLDNIRIDLLPSILEIVDKGVYSQRLFEKTKLLLEQSLKFALASKNKAALFEKTNDWREQQRVSSHSLLDLFAPISNSFEGDINSILTYFSQDTPSEHLRESVAKALAVSERLLKFSTKKEEEFALASPPFSQALPLQFSVEIESSVFALASTLLQMKQRLAEKEEENEYLVHRIDEKETKQSILQRQFFLTTCLATMEKTVGRLQAALTDGKEDVPLAYCGELCHTTALLMENALSMLIAYHRIPGDGGGHKLFQKVSSQTQTRMIRHVHHLKQLGEILQNHFEKDDPDNHLFADSVLERSIETLQTYNIRTHRYLGQDQTPIGKEFKKLHTEMQWGGQMTPEFKKFRDEYIHKNVLDALEATMKLLKELPL